MKKVLLSLLFIIGFIIINTPLANALLLSEVGGIIFIGTVGTLLLLYGQKRKKEEKEYKQYVILIFSIVLIINLLFLLGWFQTPWPTPFLEHKEMCLTFLKQGTLYGGQPYCPQGPVTYFIAFILTFLPWQLETDIQVGSLLLLFILATFLYVWKKEETNDNGKVLICILFVLYFIRLAEDSFSSLVPTVLLVFSAYFLWVSKNKNKEVIGGIFLGLCLFSKANFLLPVGSIILFYIIERATGKKEISLIIKILIPKEKIKTIVPDILKIILPIAVIFFMLKIFFPNFIVYYYTAQAKHISVSELIGAIKVLASATYAYNGVFLLFYISLAVSFLRIITRKAIDIYSWMCSVIFLFMMTLMVNAYEVTNISETYRFFFAIMPFFLINLIKIKQEIKDWGKNSIIAATILLFIIGFFLYQGIGGINAGDFIDGSVLHEEIIMGKIQREMLFPLVEIPPQQQKILIDENYTRVLAQDSSQNPYLYLNESAFDFITFTDSHAEEKPDMSYAPYLLELGVLPSLEPYNWSIEINLTLVNGKFQKSDYPIIVGGVYYGPVHKVVIDNFAFFKEKYHCAASIGVFDNGYIPKREHRIVLYFMNEMECEYLKAKVRDYYTKKFDKLCQRGNYAEIIINEIFEKNKEVPLGKKCNSWTKTTEFMVAANFKALYLW